MLGRSQAAPYHVVGVFSGVGEEILLSVGEQLILFLRLELLELLHLPTPLGTLHPLLPGETESQSGPFDVLPSTGLTRSQRERPRREGGLPVLKRQACRFNTFRLPFRVVKKKEEEFGATLQYHLRNKIWFMLGATDDICCIAFDFPT